MGTGKHIGNIIACVMLDANTNEMTHSNKVKNIL